MSPKLITGLLALSLGLGGCAYFGRKEAKTTHQIRESCDRGKASDCLKLAKTASKRPDGLTESILYARKSCERASATGCSFLAQALTEAGDDIGAAGAREQAARLKKVQ